MAALLDLLREAGDHAVTIDELRVAGVPDPAAELRALEHAGHPIEVVREDRFACVRLAASAH